MITETVTFVSFLVTSLIAISGCLWWLVKKVINLLTSTVKENTEAFKDLKNAIYNNTQATNELKQTINAKL